ncbi:MAG: hypothetical protein AAF705_21435 [Bacteroidota bacterium]
MQALWEMAVSPAIIFYTVFLGLMLFYWVTVFIGVLDLDFLDLDLDLDVDADLDLDVDLDVDADVDVDADGDIGGGGGGSWLTQLLNFLNVGAVPFMVYLSFLAISMWILAILGNVFFGTTIPAFPFTSILPILILSLLSTKVVTWPLGKVFSHMKHESVSKKMLVGKMARLTMDAFPGKLSQAEITHDNEHILLSVKSTEETDVLKRGSQVLLTEYQTDKDVFLVHHFEI